MDKKKKDIRQNLLVSLQTSSQLSLLNPSIDHLHFFIDCLKIAYEAIILDEIGTSDIAKMSKINKMKKLSLDEILKYNNKLKYTTSYEDEILKKAIETQIENVEKILKEEGEKSLKLQQQIIDEEEKNEEEKKSSSKLKRKKSSVAAPETLSSVAPELLKRLNELMLKKRNFEWYEYTKTKSEIKSEPKPELTLDEEKELVDLIKILKQTNYDFENALTIEPTRDEKKELDMLKERLAKDDGSKRKSKRKSKRRKSKRRKSKRRKSKRRKSKRKLFLK
jgi:hypothetical protein